MKRSSLILALPISLVALLTACVPASQEAVTIRVGVLPILDSLPLYIAEEQGYFEGKGVGVSFVPVASAPERDQLMQSGQIDAMINELVSVLFYNRDEVQVVAVRFARTATETYPVFRIVASASSDVETLDDLRGVPIGISEGTVIEYTTDRILTKAGFAPQEIATVAVPKIPDRLSLLESGQLQAANLPDPAASLAIFKGARPIIDDTTYPEISSSLISFSKPFLDEHPEAVRAFLAALEEAVSDLNADKGRWNDLLVEKGLVPPPLLETYALPDFATAGVPSRAQFADALEWAMSHDLVQRGVDYETSVDGSYLP